MSLKQERLIVPEDAGPKVSGLVVASDGVSKHNLLDVINTPFYGGWKILLKDKILNPNILLAGGRPLIEPAIQSMFTADSVTDFVIVGNEDQLEDLEGVASRNSNGKPYKIVSNRGDIGEAVSTGADSVHSPGYFFAIMPDLPFVNGQAIDFAVSDVLSRENLGADVYLPIISSDFLDPHSKGWRSTFSRLQNGAKSSGYRGLNFIIANSQTINPEAVRKYYDIRMIHSPKGKINAVRHFPGMAPDVALKYLTGKLSLQMLEEMGSELYRGQMRIVLVSDPMYVSLLKDIDTLGDYTAIYKKSQKS